MGVPFGVVLMLILPIASGRGDDPVFPTYETSEGPMYEISGRAHPELIPQYALWGMFFKEVQSAKRNNNLGFLKHMGVAAMSAGGAVALDKAVAAQTSNAEACQKRLKDLVEALTKEKASPKTMHRETSAGIIRCRQEHIDAGEHLMSVLSSIDQAIVRHRLEVIRHTISISVLARDMEIFSLPK